jgi:hypothetical protein
MMSLTLDFKGDDHKRQVSWLHGVETGDIDDSSASDASW